MGSRTLSLYTVAQDTKFLRYLHKAPEAQEYLGRMYVGETAHAQISKSLMQLLQLNINIGQIC